ncbi:uncharacterized protein LOC124459776 [Drosophila willistoni]|uniref:uncharacterized protein LOC124459776 n=1 Tax=Drosophila willistoni TaxID=7260 RepID=UPI001F078498|nr:uncharacterized protein LOC124459776 [Drosophila willistoni]
MEDNSLPSFGQTFWKIDKRESAKGLLALVLCFFTEPGVKIGVIFGPHRPHRIPCSTQRNRSARLVHEYQGWHRVIDLLSWKRVREPQQHHQCRENAGAFSLLPRTMSSQSRM